MKNTHVCYLKFDFVRIFHKVKDIGMKYVTYWYRFFMYCEELVPIFHNVKVAKSEICGSTYTSDIDHSNNCTLQTLSSLVSF